MTKREADPRTRATQIVHHDGGHSMKVTEVIDGAIEHGAPPGSIGRIWKVAGWTTFNHKLSSARILVQNTAGTANSITHLAVDHERGHVDVARDILASSIDGAEAFKVLKGHDRWQIEVEAWLHGLEQSRVPNLVESHFHFILDCLNSYRRALSVTDEQWEEAVRLIAEDIADVDELLAYKPLEPDPGEEPPSCMPGIPYPASDSDSDGDDPTLPFEEGDFTKGDSLFDRRWLLQDVLTDLRTRTINEVAIARGLDPTRVPPLIAAMKGPPLIKGVTS